MPLRLSEEFEILTGCRKQVSVKDASYSTYKDFVCRRYEKLLLNCLQLEHSSGVEGERTLET